MAIGISWGSRKILVSLSKDKVKEERKLANSGSGMAL